MPPPMTQPRWQRLRRRLGDELAARVSPERTRRATWVERVTVQRLPWEWVVRLHRYLEVAGKLTFALWVAFIATVVLGVHWRDVIESAFNSGKPVKTAVVLAIIIPTLLFVAARSAIGFARWRLQRELWRRDVERLGRTNA